MNGTILDEPSFHIYFSKRDGEQVMGDVDGRVRLVASGRLGIYLVSRGQGWDPVHVRRVHTTVLPVTLSWR